MFKFDLRWDILEFMGLEIEIEKSKRKMEKLWLGF